MWVIKAPSNTPLDLGPLGDISGDAGASCFRMDWVVFI